METRPTSSPSVRSREGAELPIGRDLVGAPYKVWGRDPETGIDCLGVVLELYRRLGIELPDPRPGEESIREYMRIWEEVEEPDRLLDILRTRIGPEEVVWLNVGKGYAMGAESENGVHLQRIRTIRRGVKDLRFYRLIRDFAR